MNYIIIALMILTLLVVLGGFALMVKGGDANRKYSNKLMTLRVVLQALAIALLAVIAMAV